MVDISDGQSMESALKKIEPLDAIVCIVGEAKWANFTELTEDDYYIGLKSKHMGQVNLVRIGQRFLRPGGSITLYTGFSR